jgi:uncharacterized membrane protein YfcA
MIEPHFAAIGAGMIVGFSLGLVGGGGSVLAVPLLVYGVGVAEPHIPIGTSAAAVAVSALANLISYARKGAVKWRCAAAFTLMGMVGARLGAEAAKAVDGKRLLALFGGARIAANPRSFCREPTCFRCCRPCSPWGFSSARSRDSLASAAAF